MGLESEIGAIAPGMRADLILVEGNPLEDIRALRSLRMVIRDGVPLDPLGAPPPRGASPGGPEPLSLTAPRPVL
jgi:hypothetical protein